MLEGIDVDEERAGDERLALCLWKLLEGELALADEDDVLHDIAALPQHLARLDGLLAHHALQLRHLRHREVCKDGVGADGLPRRRVPQLRAADHALAQQRPPAHQVLEVDLVNLNHIDVGDRRRGAHLIAVSEQRPLPEVVAVAQLARDAVALQLDRPTLHDAKVVSWVAGLDDELVGLIVALVRHEQQVNGRRHVERAEKVGLQQHMQDVGRVRVLQPRHGHGDRVIEADLHAIDTHLLGLLDALGAHVDDLQILPQLLRQSLERFERRVDRRDAGFVEKEVRWLDGAAVEQPFPPRLGDDAAVLELKQRVGVVARVARVRDRLAAQLGAEADARQRVQRVEEGDGPALKVHGLGDLRRVEEEEAEQELVGHARDEGVLADEGGHDRLRRHHRHALLEQNLLERARVVVGVAMGEDHMRHFTRRDAVLVEVLR
mmetsp:Transcript_1508/g.4271  ORF Transcript_1508/g.4271 Transcript_1508/m.4271 type:complete len:434 (+) Transcript_1508:140-1441(+)